MGIRVWLTSHSAKLCSPNPAGLAVDNNSGRVFVADTENRDVRVIEGWF